jgi:hypothetical protein
MNKQNNNKQCDTCKGIGLIKNLYCDKCNGYKCTFTNNIDSKEFYKYKFCQICENNSENNNENNNEKLNKKKLCKLCVNKGYYYNEYYTCLDCKIQHIICICFIKNPYEECNICYGSGILE